MPAQDTNRLTALEQLVQQLLEENKTLKSLARSAGDERVTVRHSGYGPSIVIPLDNDKSVVFSNQKGQKFYQLPMEVYLELKNATPFFEMGYLYTDDELDNPNLILDVEEWYKGSSERKLLKQLEEITSPGTLNMIYAFTEGKSDGKALSVRTKVSERLNEVLDIIMYEDTQE